MCGLLLSDRSMEPTCTCPHSRLPLADGSVWKPHFANRHPISCAEGPSARDRPPMRPVLRRTGFPQHDNTALYASWPPGRITGKGFTAAYKSRRQAAAHLKDLIPVQLYLCPSVPADMKEKVSRKDALTQATPVQAKQHEALLLRCIFTAARLPLSKPMN